MIHKSFRSRYVLSLLLVVFPFSCYAVPVTPKNHSKQVDAAHKIENKTNGYNKHQTNNIKKDNALYLQSDQCDFQKNQTLHIKLQQNTLVAYMNISNLVADPSNGSNFNLMLRYNSSNNDLYSPGLLSFSYGWSWNLTHFFQTNNPGTNNKGRLLTSRGQCFDLYIKGYHRQQWVPCNNQSKGSGIKITGRIFDHFVITYTDGSQEILNHDGFQTHLKQPNGKSINFGYGDLGFLNSVYDNEGNKIILKYPGTGLLTVTSYDNNKQPVQLRLFVKKQKGLCPVKVVPPGKNSHTNSIVSLNYNENNCITRIKYSNGLTEFITYKYGKGCSVYSIRMSKPGCQDKIIH